MTRVYLHTFGCKANQYDTEVIRQALETSGAVSVPDPSEADVAIVNSCTVTHVSEAKMRGLVRRIARRNSQARTVVMGCAAELDDGRIAALPGVSRVVGGSDPVAVLNAAGIDVGTTDPLLHRFERGARAWLKIQDGCDEHCTFCATTLARGDSRSRSPAEIIAEAQSLGGNHEEIVLTGVHIGAYGAERHDGFTLGTLVQSLVNEVPRVRFRLSSIEATEIDDTLADLLVSAPERLAPHIHAPLQSGSDRLLKLMGRHWYTARSYRERIEWLAARVPRLGLGADVMVGFPTETEDDHAGTRSLIESLPFTYLHVFPYSERPGSAAMKLGSPVAPQLSQHRSSELRALAEQKSQAYRRGRHDDMADVILLRRTKGRYEALTGDYLTVFVRTDTVVKQRSQARLRLEDGDMWAVPQEAAG
ncbi:MAG: MiaB/RimO family radical SAM methylthiotransferase [Gemmatimonadota bacterium]|nr:MAG: MiaB/RimO family radical SAM methylthiotransferase [Gemmatimonadota bacterium]